MIMPTNSDLEFDHENLTICENLSLYSQMHLNVCKVLEKDAIVYYQQLDIEFLNIFKQQL